LILFYEKKRKREIMGIGDEYAIMNMKKQSDKRIRE
jgi:hypothetical protein